MGASAWEKIKEGAVQVGVNSALIFFDESIRCGHIGNLEGGLVALDSATGWGKAFMACGADYLPVIRIHRISTSLFVRIFSDVDIRCPAYPQPYSYHHSSTGMLAQAIIFIQAYILGYGTPVGHASAPIFRVATSAALACFTSARRLVAYAFPPHTTFSRLFSLKDFSYYVLLIV